MMSMGLLTAGDATNTSLKMSVSMSGSMGAVGQFVASVENWPQNRRTQLQNTYDSQTANHHTPHNGPIPSP
jgi:hypothetical protein